MHKICNFVLFLPEQRLVPPPRRLLRKRFGTVIRFYLPEFARKNRNFIQYVKDIRPKILDSFEKLLHGGLLSWYYRIEDILLKYYSP